MKKIIAIVNQKGGVGKTTTTINLAAALAKLKRTVLLIDLDPQGNATVGSGIPKNELKFTMQHVLLHKKSLKEARLGTDFGYDILPTNQDLVVAEVELLRVTQRESRLKKSLESVATEYDYILIDCPPSLNILTVNALTAARSVLIPLQCDYFALEGLSGLLSTIQDIQQSINPNLQIEGILRTMFDSRNRLTLDVSAQLLNHFSKKVYNTVIPRNVRLAEAPSHGMPVIQYDEHSQGAQSYLSLAREIERPIKRAQPVKKKPSGILRRLATSAMLNIRRKKKCATAKA